ncbi:hypothetical protein CWO08_18535, partial [Vibrio sp. 10N.286.48.B8]
MRFEFRSNDDVIEMLLDGNVIYNQKKRGEQSSIDYINDPSTDLINTLISFKVKEIPYPLHLEMYERINDIMMFNFEKDTEDLSIRVSYDINLEEWAFPFTIHTFLAPFHSKLQDLGLKTTQEPIDDNMSYTTISLNLHSEQEIRKTLEDVSLKVSSTANAILDDLSRQSFGKHVLKAFRFP